MAYYSSLGTVIQMAEQSDWIDSASTSKALPELTVQVPATGESMSMSFERLEPETMMGSRFKEISLASTASCSGDINAPLSFDFSDFLFKQLFGSVSTTTSSSTVDGYTIPVGAKSYEFGAVGSAFPLSSMAINRGNQELASYPNLTINSLSLSCANNETCDATISLLGTEEVIGTSAYTGIEGYKEPEELSSSALPFINTKSVLKVSGTSRCAESVQIDINNNAQDAPRCFQDGQLSNRPYFGRKEATLSVSMPWDGADGLFADLKESYYGKDKTLSASFKFEDGNGHNVLFFFPACYVSNDSYNASGTGLIDGTIDLEVAEKSLNNGTYTSVEPIQVYTWTVTA